VFPSALRREIIVLIAAKVLLLAVLYVLFFSPEHRLNATPERIRAHLFQSSHLGT
jgi:type II secretory pathway component PulM